MTARNFEDFTVGESVTFEREILPEDVTRFVELTGDDNPVHVDDEYATQVGLPARVVHGMLTSSYVSTVIGTMLPGPGALWMSERFNFRAPVFVGDRILVEVSIRRLSPGTRMLVLDVKIENGRGTLVLDGEAHVHVPEQAREMSEPQQDAKTVVVTGAGRGIGAAIAKRLAMSGLRVVVNYRTDEKRARETLDEIVSGGGEASVFAADVSSPGDVAALIAFATETYGRVDALVNNAGTPTDPRPLADTTWETVEKHLAAHLRGSFLSVEATLPGMVGRGFGRIVNVTSQSAYGVPPPKLTGYVVAKAALAAFTRCIAAEAGPHGVTANAVAPGMTPTEMVADVSHRAKAMLAAQTPLRRLAQVGDIADTVDFLIGPGGAYVTGQTIHLSGGQEMS
jgi:3-oxoacyl-[acyl-carrier protein] reductase